MDIESKNFIKMSRFNPMRLYFLKFNKNAEKTSTHVPKAVTLFQNSSDNRL